MTYRKSQYIKL